MTSRRFHWPLIVGMLAASSALGAQDTTTPPAVPVTVLITARGFVFDSIAGRPIFGASVQFAGLDSANRKERYATQSDSGGRFTIPGVVPGRYLAGFFDAALDTLGIESNGQPVDIEGPNQTIVLAVPSARTLGAAFCGPAMASSPGFTLLYGRARDAETDSTLVGGTVSIMWAEARTDSGKTRLVDRSTTVSIRQGGTFAACGLPSDQTLTIRAVRGADSSGALFARIPKGGLRHMVLAVATPGATSRLTGHVYDSGHVPIPGAHATFTFSDRLSESIADVSGAYSFDSLPAGTHSMTVRAIGHAPRDVVVQLAASRLNTMDVILEKVTTLPTVVSTADARLQQFFADKTKTATQAFFIQPPHPIDYPPMMNLCQLLLGLPGVGVSCDGGPMNIKHTGFCYKTNGFILNGKPWMGDFDSVDPKNILGVEYFPRNVPAQYEGYIHSMKLCPVVVWTK